MVETRSKFTIVIFIITYLIIFLQLWAVIITEDITETKSYLFYHKIYFFILLIMIIWTQIKCFITDPGIINSTNNPTVLEFYLNIHDLAIRRAEKFNMTYGDAFFKNIREDDEELKTLNDSEEEVSDEDETEYKNETSISDDVMNSIKSEYKVKLKRCFQCFVVRAPRGHHCSFCKGCVMKMDHHCPWVNNCIGQFTQKFFILFCFYSLCACLEVLTIEFYYGYYKSRLLFNGKLKTFGICIQLLFNVVFLIFSFIMLRDQWGIIQNDSTMIDLKKKRFEEKRDISEVLNETFGCGFGLSWFLPIKIGGYKPFFLKLLKGRRRN